MHIKFIIKFDFFWSPTDNTDYELKLLYLQGLGNLKLGKVTEYLDPIIRDETQSNDIRFMATWIKESVAEQSSSNERRKNYETFWPIFENRSAPIELRVAAFNTLLRSNPTSARLMSIHTLMENETNPHLVNFYRTTLMSLAGTTQPCYQKLYIYHSTIFEFCSYKNVVCKNTYFFFFQTSIGIINDTSLTKSAS